MRVAGGEERALGAATTADEADRGDSADENDAEGAAERDSGRSHSGPPAVSDAPAGATRAIL